MDEKTARKLTRQLRFLNVFLVFFTLIFVAGLVIAGIAAYKVVHEVHQAETKLTNLQDTAQQNLNFKSRLCDSTGTVGSLLQRQSDVCD